MISKEFETSQTTVYWILGIPGALLGCGGGRLEIGFTRKK